MATKTRLDTESSTARPAGLGGEVQPKGVKEAATGVADEAGRTLETTAARSMSQVGDVLRQVASAVRQSSESLQTEQPQVGRMISAAADKLDDAATFVSAREPTQLLDEAQQYARRQPAMVIGGGLLAGLLIGRSLRSAGAQPGPVTTDDQDWYASSYRDTSADRARRGSDVSSGYGTGYGASYDQATSSGTRRGNGSGQLAATKSSAGFDPAEG